MALRYRQHSWVLLLAARETAPPACQSVGPTSATVARQFSSVEGTHSPLENAIEPATAIVSRERICVTVGVAHRRYCQESREGALACGELIQIAAEEARECGLSQSQASRIIADLEADLGTRPLSRSTGAVVPTEQT
jgi:hypothetical protein